MDELSQQYNKFILVHYFTENFLDYVPFTGYL